MFSKTAVYLGDAVYADFDGYQVRLSTTNGIVETNEIYLEPKVLSNFLQYLEDLKKEYENGKK
jgi:hypothetical protein